jgi:ArsR family metal-binding transcriptional regulator
MNNYQGIVIKYEVLKYKEALHYAHLVLALYSKANKYIKDLFPQENNNEVESIRMITKSYEMVIAQHGNFTLVALHTKNKPEVKAVVEGGEKKEGEVEKKEAT